jgi:hypothetical protein
MLSLSSNHIAYICVVTVFAYSLRGATGFGAAAAMPLMGLWCRLKSSCPRGRCSVSAEQRPSSGATDATSPGPT